MLSGNVLVTATDSTPGRAAIRSIASRWNSRARVLVVSLQAEIDARRHRAARVEAEVDGGSVLQAAHDEQRTDQQDRRQRHLQRRRRDRACATRAPAARLVLERRYQVGPRALERGHEADEERAQGGEREARTPARDGRRRSKSTNGRSVGGRHAVRAAASHCDRSSARTAPARLSSALSTSDAADEIRSAGAEREPDRRLALQIGRSRQQQPVRFVHVSSRTSRRDRLQRAGEANDRTAQQSCRPGPAATARDACPRSSRMLATELRRDRIERRLRLGDATPARASGRGGRCCGVCRRSSQSLPDSICACIIIGTQTSAASSRSVPRNPAGMTPMIVKGLPLIGRSGRRSRDPRQTALCQHSSAQHQDRMPTGNGIVAGSSVRPRIGLHAEEVEVVSRWRDSPRCEWPCRRRRGSSVRCGTRRCPRGACCGRGNRGSRDTSA